ncbi:GNAT family N-acetyltransferase [Oceanirhabdus sp. W0125-5]|uniref:GNAT family N-acetyltransferase n=1 Tax=Oceanirhabdus sp. W0125-5 TaxID=2999116 RepID=UPI0022F30A39|nr:GNAT family N-acetyltransferase [Oceanirhabdus sp. W0125-5]WBW96946.1 GNAT family N-acetyltransferase [Oceanirhabdus sp. W0125-5]
MLNIRRAIIQESETLTNIAIQSEAYWGFDSDYMEQFKFTYKVTEEFIKNNPTFIIENDEKIIGFYSILINEHEVSLEYLYIDPEFIGKGYGKRLWNHMIEKCKNLAIKEIEIVTSPEAKEFYIKMGAVQTGEIQSLVKKERIIPQLTYKI